MENLITCTCEHPIAWHHLWRTAYMGEALVLAAGGACNHPDCACPEFVAA